MPLAASSTQPLPSFVLVQIAAGIDVDTVDQRLQYLVSGGSGSVLFAVGDGWYAISRAPGKELRIAAGGDNERLFEYLGGIPGIIGVELTQADELIRRYETRGPAPAAPVAPPAVAPQQWNLECVNAHAAWNIMGGFDGFDWGSIRIGHLDTGYTQHPVFGPWNQGLSPSLLPQEGMNFFDQSPGPGDPLPNHGTPGHGTRTSSILTGRADGTLLGIAPRVPVVPYRVTDFVVIDTLGWQNRMGEAINHAVLSTGCSVLSISLGDPCYAPSEMGRAIDQAYERGVIVVAAAGNYTSEGTYPGRYSRVISAGGITVGDQPWNGSSRGSWVTLSAPADQIWRADSVRQADGSTRYIYGGDGDGTSYATVHISAAAVMWRAHHGHALDNLYAARPWQYVEAFRKLVTATARVPNGWNGKQFGAGVLDIAALLKADLPAPDKLVKQDRLAENEHS